MPHSHAPSPANLGPWSAEPVHDAIVAQRLHDLTASLRETLDVAVAGVPAAHGSHPGLVRAIRVRIGHALVAVGAFVEGHGDRVDGEGVRTA